MKNKILPLKKGELPRPPKLSRLDDAGGEGVVRSTKKVQIFNRKKYKKQRRSLRNNPTMPETLLWKHLRNSAIGYKFRRQHSIGNYIVDFYCPKVSVVIEVDGYVHGEEKQRQKDVWRQKYIENQGIHVVRYTNEQILFDIDVVLQHIRWVCDNRANHL